MINLDSRDIAEEVLRQVIPVVRQTARDTIASTLRPTISQEEVAEMFGVTEQTVRMWYKRGYIARFAFGRVTTYDRESVLEFYQQHRIKRRRG